MIVFRQKIAVVGDEPPPGAGHWTPANYEDAVLTVLNNIAGRGTGNIVLNALGGHAMWILPGTPQHTGAEAVSNQDAFADGARQRVCKTGERGVPPGSPVPGGGRGTGLGSQVKVYFTPIDWRGKVRAGEAQDEILLHELVHAYRKLTGTERCRPWGTRMDTEEEVLAIAVTNMYASERSRPLRDDHTGFTEMNNAKAWMRRHWLPLRRFKDDPLAKDLSKVPTATFHPFQE